MSSYNKIPNIEESMDIEIGLYTKVLEGKNTVHPAYMRWNAICNVCDRKIRDHSLEQLSRCVKMAIKKGCDINLEKN